MGTTSYRFGDYRLDRAARELWRGDERINLPPKSFDCLAYLIEHRERAVGRDELISAVWGRADVNDALLAQTLLRARRAVGDTGSDQSAIRTVPRFGYRWVAPVERFETTEPATPLHVEATPAVAAASPTTPQRRWGDSVTAVFIIAFTLAVLWLGYYTLAPRYYKMADVDPNPVALVLPVELDDVSADAAWIRLGVMDYVASRLRDDGKLAVVPSERVVALAASATGDKVTRRRKIQQTTGAAIVVQPVARTTAQGWRIELTWHAGARDETASGDGATALVAATQATDALLARVDRRGTATTAPPPTESTELVQRLDAAMLAGDIAAARAALDAAPPALRADPDVEVRRAQIDFRAGRIDNAERAFGALRDRLTVLPTAVQAQALMGLGAVAVRRGDFPAAERRYAEALAALGPNADAELAGNGYSGRGVARAAQGRYEEALADFGRARVALERAGDQPGAASVDTNRGVLENNRRRWRDAVQAFDRAIAVFERYDVRDNLAASLLGKTLAQVALLDLDAALRDSERAWQLAAALENPVLVDGLRHARIRALLASGKLGDAAALLDADAGVEHAPSTTGDVDALRIRLALARGDAATAIAAARRHASDHAGAEADLLLATAALAANDATPLPEPADDDGADAAALALAHALRLRLRNDDGAAAAFAQAQAAADRDGTPDARVDVARHYIPLLIARHELDRASAVAGDVAPYAERDFRAARALAQLYGALDDQALLAQANARVKALAGERDVGKAFY